MSVALFAEPQPRFDGPLAIREVTRTTAIRWVTEWHYTRRMPNGSAIAYGAFAPDLIAVVMLSIPTNPHGVASRLGLSGWPGNREICRVVAHPDAPKNTASRAIAACCRVWRGRGWRWVFSYADTGQGHHGGIYQALNAIYVGTSAPAPDNFLVDGLLTQSRSVGERFGTLAWPAVRAAAAAQGVDLTRVSAPPRHTYVLPVGLPAERRAIRRALSARALPYPKRDTAEATP
jgi:hypothetical protein